MCEEVATRLNNHLIFQSLIDKLPQEKNKCMNLITCRNDILYIWNSNQKCIDTVNIKLVLKEADFTGYISIQPNPSLFFNVEKISVNSTSTLMVLYGPNGLAVLQLPERWLLKEKLVEVRCITLAQKLFLSDHHTLREVKWHPGSPTDSHLLLLTSDECLRLYDALEETLIWEKNLSTHVIRKNIPNMVSIGETPVGFDFGLGETFEGSDNLRWPIFIVWGNGDVFSITTCIEESDFRTNLEGPFRMVPSSDDNYGVDASSIAVMETTPPLIVVATCKGMLWHSLLLTDKSDRETNKVLHVIEKIELEIGISLNSEGSDDVISCPVTVEKDPFENSRYFCIHIAGIHSFTLPIVQKLVDYSNTDNIDFPLFGTPSFGEYLLCTAITVSSELMSTPILGVGYVDAAKMLILLSSGKLINVPLGFHSKSPLLRVTKKEEVYKTNTVTEEDPLQIIVQNMLKESGIASCPVIKLPGEKTKPKDWLEIVRQTTQMYRTVVNTHSEVARKICEKSETLRATLLKQLSQLDALQKQKNELRSTAEQVAEKYEEINEKLPEMTKRVEKLLLRVECSGTKTLTAREKLMSNLLEKAKIKLDEMSKDHQAVKASLNSIEGMKPIYQKEIFLDNQTALIYKHSKYLLAEINSLMLRLKAAQDTVSQYHIPIEF